MGSTPKKHVEVEDKEILIKSSNGYMAIVPKNMAPWVREHIESGNHHIVDGYVKSLQEMKDGGKAKKGGVLKPPTKAIEADAVKVDRFPKPPNKDARKPIVQPAPLGTLLVRGMKYDNKLLGGHVGEGGHPNETYSDVVYRLSRTPGTIQNRLFSEQQNRIFGAVGDVAFNPVNLIPAGGIAANGLKMLSSVAKTAKVAKALNRMAKMAKPAAIMSDVAEGEESYSNYPNKPPIKDLTNDQQKFMAQMISNMNKYKSK